MQHLHVSCAIIQNNEKVLCVQRSASMRMPLKWEFPGGKIDCGETPDSCVVRECKEELGITIVVKKKMSPSTWNYSLFMVTLYPFICVLKAGTIELREHVAARWLMSDELETLDWADADRPVIEEYRSIIC